jgi:hypothetical protein
MARIDLPFYAAVAMCAGLAMFARGFRDLRTRRLIRNTPTARIRSMAMGLVEVNGTVLERSLVRAPFTGRECAYWEVDISIRAGRRGGHRVVHRRSSGNPFYVGDGTGIALVYPSGSDCKVPAGSEEQCMGLFMPELYGHYMTEQRLWQRYLWRMSTMRFRERTLEEGQRVYILGTAVPRAQSRDVSNPVLTEHPAERASWVEPALRATGTEGGGAHLAQPGARLANPTLAANTLARTSPAVQLRAVAATASGSEHPPSIPPRGPGRVKAMHDQIAAVIRRGDHDTTFIISTESELALEISYGFSTLASLFGGPLLTIVGLVYWIYARAGRHLLG